MIDYALSAKSDVKKCECCDCKVGGSVYSFDLWDVDDHLLIVDGKTGNNITEDFENNSAEMKIIKSKNAQQIRFDFASAALLRDLITKKRGQIVHRATHDSFFCKICAQMSVVMCKFCCVIYRAKCL